MLPAKTFCTSCSMIACKADALVCSPLTLIETGGPRSSSMISRVLCEQSDRWPERFAGRGLLPALVEVRLICLGSPRRDETLRPHLVEGLAVRMDGRLAGHALPALNSGIDVAVIEFNRMGAPSCPMGGAERG